MLSPNDLIAHFCFIMIFWKALKVFWGSATSPHPNRDTYF